MKKTSLLSGTNFKYAEFSKLFSCVTKMLLAVLLAREALISILNVALCSNITVTIFGSQYDLVTSQYDVVT